MVPNHTDQGDITSYILVLKDLDNELNTWGTGYLPLSTCASKLSTTQHSDVSCIDLTLLGPKKAYLVPEKASGADPCLDRGSS